VIGKRGFSRKRNVLFVIILDTNQLESVQPPDGPLIAMLQTLAKQAGHALWLPDIALEEHLAHYRQTVTEAERKRVAATDDLRVRYPRWRADIRPFNVDEAVRDRTMRIQSVFQIRRTPDSACRESLLREARRIPPARVAWGGPGAGARDVAIWLTAVDACRESGDETFFVSADKAAFGEALKPELTGDLDAALGGRAGAFHYCCGVDALLSELGTSSMQTPGREQIASSAAVRRAVTLALAEPPTIFDLAEEAAIATASSVIGGPKLPELVSLGREVAYQVGDSVWACARPTWRAMSTFRAVIRASDVELRPRDEVAVTFNIATTLVMQVDEESHIASAEVTARSQAYNVREVVS
jgi:hypothetical protein